jgi:Predicted periplasmic protein (DUF2092)
MSRPPLPFRYLAFLAAAAVISTVVALAACGGSPTSRTSSATRAPVSSSSPGTSPQAQQILLRVQQASLQSANVNVLATETSSGRGTVTSSTGQITRYPARAQLSTSLSSAATSSGTTQRQAQEVYDNGILYVKLGNQTKWTRYAWPTVSSTTGEAPSQAAPYLSLQNLAQMQNVQLVGTETVNGVTTYHLHASGSQAANGQSVTYTEGLWVNQSNYQPVKMMVQEQTSAGQLAATATFSKWNGGQTITPPAASEVTNP